MLMANSTVNVIGAGLAGCEAAWQIANQGIQVNLYEMRPVKSTPAHKTDLFENWFVVTLTGAGLEMQLVF